MRRPRGPPGRPAGGRPAANHGGGPGGRPACHATARRSSPAVPGTGLSGGAVPVAEGIVIGLARMNRILDIDVPNRRVGVEPGVTNLDSHAPSPARALLRPDPSSQQACTIGGNVAENSGGAAHAEVRRDVNHVLGARGGPARRRVVGSAGRPRTPGYDLTACSSARRGRSGSPPDRWCASSRGPSGADPARRVRAIDAAGEACRGIIAAGHRPRGARDDGHAHDPGRRGGFPRRAFRATPAPS